MVYILAKIVTKHIGQHIVPFKETDSDLLLQPKLFPLFYVKFISKWVALIVSYLQRLGSCNDTCTGSKIYAKLYTRQLMDELWTIEELNGTVYLCSTHRWLDVLHRLKIIDALHRLKIVQNPSAV